MTINVKSWVPLFGDFHCHSVILNKYGHIIDKQWNWLQSQNSYINLDEYIIMPDHVHGIIEITHDWIQTYRKQNQVRTSRDLSIPNNKRTAQKIKSLSEIIGAFKTTSSKFIHIAGFKSFQWHRSFYDRIIESDEELENIREYIRQNPDNYQK